VATAAAARSAVMRLAPALGAYFSIVPEHPAGWIRFVGDKSDLCPAGCPGHCRTTFRAFQASLWIHFGEDRSAL